LTQFGRRRLLAGAAGALLVPQMLLAPRAFAQRPGRNYRIGNLYVADSATSRPYEESFLAGMRELGFERGRNLIFDVRNCDGDQSRLPAAVDELIALKPDLLLGIEQTARVMRSKTSTIPIVLAQSNDPVAAGLIKSLARPGGNVTGVAALTELMAAKQIEMLGQILPSLKTIAIVLDPGVPAAELIEQHVRAAAQTIHARVIRYLVKDRETLDQAFAQIDRDRPDAIAFSSGSGTLFGFRQILVENAMRRRLPSSSVSSSFADLGALFSYGPSLLAMFRHAASYAARILNGANPAELPVEQPTVYELVVNLRTARILGVAIPQVVLLRADRVIE